MLQSSLLGNFEDSIRQHERACAEKSMLEEKLQAKLEEYESLKSQTQEASSVQSSAANAQSRITDCEREIEIIKAKFEKLELTIEEQSMKVKRGRNTVVLKTEKMLATVAQQNQAETWEKVKDEMRIKEREVTQTIQEKDLRIKELEIESKQYCKESFLNQSHNVGPLDILNTGKIGLVLTSLQRSGHKKLIDWRNLGSQLGFTTKELNEIDKDRSKDKLFKMLNDWGHWYPGNSRGSINFATYSGLQRAFVKIGLGDIVLHMVSY